MLLNSRQEKGFSLVELLVVIAIILVLAGLLFPIFANAKLNAFKTTCTSNLRQAGVGLGLYLEQNDGFYPVTTFGQNRIPWPAVAPIVNRGGGAASGILRCPLDVPEGRRFMPLIDRSEPISYKNTWLLWGGNSGVAAWGKLVELDPNPVVLRCYLHDDHMRKRMLSDLGERGAMNNAHSLVLRRDGSVTFSKKADRAEIIEEEGQLPKTNYKGDHWVNASDVPCPSEICDGKYPEDLGVKP